MILMTNLVFVDRLFVIVQCTVSTVRFALDCKSKTKVEP